MKSFIRKNAFVRALPARVEGKIAEKLFRDLEVRPQSIQSKRVEQVLERLSRLGQGDWAAFFQKSDLLNRYEGHPSLALSRSGLRVDMVAKHLSEEDEWEHQAVFFLLSLVPHRINRLRRCAHDGCKRWFYAKRNDREWCSGACKQRNYESTPEQRESKKLYMRKYRVDQKEREERQKRAVGFRGRVMRRAETKRSAKKPLR
ncbi:MAG: hypothetical protein ABSD88_08820 [Candidatus Korobacteraceae bacterium]|jgi:hypothetical protein